MSVTKDEVMNPAFSRFHPSKNLLYTCTESVHENGEIVTWKVCPQTGRLHKVASADAGGTSTCYLTLDKQCQNMLVVNYWDATIGVFNVDGKQGHVDKARSFYDPNNGKKMKARAEKHVNHSNNDHSAQKERQADPHSHAVVLDSYFGRIAYVPDLGMDLIRQFRYDPVEGKMLAAGTMRSGPADRKALGPRYIEFHPTLPVAYVINELSSEVSVFDFDRLAAEQLLGAPTEEVASAAPTLRLRQTIRTIPDAFPGDLNTCGRITVHTAGNFVLVSNRGHDSITVFRVNQSLLKAGQLSIVGSFHTRGATPRHFQFDASGQWLISANQDSDRIAVFRFNLATGRLEWTGHEYSVPSPNFVCNVLTHSEDASDEVFDEPAAPALSGGSLPLGLPAGPAGLTLFAPAPSPPSSKL